MVGTRLNNFLLAGVALASRLALAGSAGGYENQQKVMSWDGCLPGPLSHQDHTPCSTGADIDESAFDPAAFHPWTHKPYCPDETSYCVYTNSRYGNHGVSLIALPFDEAPSPDQSTSVRYIEVLLASTSLPKEQQRPSTLAVEPEDKPYEIRDIPGKGKGVIATRRIPRGTVLIVEHALVIADSAFPSRVRKVFGREMLQRAMARLGKGGEASILDLARSSRDPQGVPAAEDVMKTNSFTVKIAEKSHMALFPRVARANHACKPSALTRFDENTLAMTVRAIRDIEPGEEVTLSYTDFGLTYPDRQRLLRAKWGFDCTCSMCSAPASEIAASDARREKINELGQRVIKFVEDQDFKGAVKIHREMTELIEQEALAPHMGDYYEVMTRLLAASKDISKAKKYAKLAIEEFGLMGEKKEELEAFLKAK